jgi:glyoxylate reductase
MTKIFITRKINDVCVNRLKEAGFEVKVSKLNRAMKKSELVTELKKNNYDAIITLLNDTVDKQVLDASKNLKMVANFAVGFNNIDITYAKTKNIEVGVAKGTSAQAVAQHVVALAFAVADRVADGDKIVRSGKWKGWDPDFLLGQDLFGKTIGLVGTGNIGSKVAEIFHSGFGCKIIYSDMVENQNLKEKCHAEKMGLDDVLKNADIVSLHVPLMKETTHLINAKNLKLMKSTSILINTARGGVVDENALIKILKAKKIFGAGLDVFEGEPKVNTQLKKLANAVLSPHIASAKESARIEMSNATADNLINFFTK